MRSPAATRAAAAEVARTINTMSCSIDLRTAGRWSSPAPRRDSLTHVGYNTHDLAPDAFDRTRRAAARHAARARGAVTRRPSGSPSGK